jgi:orotate phosphoribosyltransferase
MNEQEALQIFGGVNAIITDSHVVYTSGKHGRAYVNKDAIYPHTRETSLLCREIAERFANDGVEVVVAPAVGGVILSQWVAHHLSEITGREVLGTYAEREYEEKILVELDKNSKPVSLILPFGGGSHGDDPSELIMTKGQKIILRKPEFSFVVRRGYDKLVRGRKILGIEDVLNTGGSVKKVVTATRILDGDIVGIGVLCNRGGVTAGDLDVPKLSSLVEVRLEAWDEKDCQLCADGVPINTSVGKGKEFLQRTGRTH